MAIGNIKGTKRPQVTLKEVAEHAGVSQMTVSRALNTPDLVRQSTRDKIRVAVEELNYRPNLMARSLAGGRALFIGLTYNNPSSGYLSELMIGALTSCRRAGFHLVVEELSNSEASNPKAVAERMRDGGMDGVILVPPLSESVDIAEALIAVGMPFILLTPGELAQKYTSVTIDDRTAARRMTEHLIDIGHREIGFIKGPSHNTQARQRLEGFRHALSDANIDVREAQIADGAFTYRSGMEAAAKLLAANANLTAIFAANDDMAAGAIAELNRQGRIVPEDISVAGFDDTALASTIWPELTTVRQPIAEMAGTAVRMLGDDTIDETKRVVEMNVDIIRRDSVSKPRAR